MLSVTQVASTVEAIVGAVWQDCKDISVVKRVMRKMKLEYFKGGQDGIGRAGCRHITFNV